MANPENKFDLGEALVRRLSELLQETDLTEIEYETEGRRIRVARQREMQVAMPGYAPSPSQPAPAAPASVGGDDAVPAGAVTSPMVGTVYVAPEPGAAPFVKVGDQVQEGQTLLIVEAMKVMNPLASPRSGKVTQILARDGQPVEFGEPLVVIE